MRCECFVLCSAYCPTYNVLASQFTVSSHLSFAAYVRACLTARNAKLTSEMTHGSLRPVGGLAVTYFDGKQGLPRNFELTLTGLRTDRSFESSGSCLHQTFSSGRTTY